MKGMKESATRRRADWRKRLSGADLLCQPPTCKRRCREEEEEAGEEEARRGGAGKENRDPAKQLRSSRGTQSLMTHDRQPLLPKTRRLEELEWNQQWNWTGTADWCQTWIRCGSGTEAADRPAGKIRNSAGTKTWTGVEPGSSVWSIRTTSETRTDLIWELEAGTGSRTTTTLGAETGSRFGFGGGAKNRSRDGSGVELQSNKPEVKVALVRKTSRQPLNQRRSGQSEGVSLRQPANQRLPGQSRWTQDKNSRGGASTAKVLSSSSAVFRAGGVSSEERLEAGGSRRRFSQGKNSESLPRRRRPSLGRGAAEAGSWRRCREELPRGRGCSLGRSVELATHRRRRIHRSGLRGRGQLWLSITPEAGQLFIQIHEARGLMGKSCRSCDSYVKLALVPDVNHSSRRKTQTVLNSKNPEYKQNFLLPVSTEDHQKRLLVSVFRRQAESRRSELIGCMSFGIRSLISSSQPVIGWFFLLGEEFGRSKHLKVTSRRSHPMSRQEGGASASKAAGSELRKTPDSTPAAPPAAPPAAELTRAAVELTELQNHGSRATCSSKPTNPNYASYITTLCANANRQAPGAGADGNSQQLTVSIVRGKDGFGFTICSDCPVRVQAVDPGGPAHHAGLQQSDSVLQLNGLPVETWKCVDLAHAIRSCPSQIVLVVWRGLPEVKSGCEPLLRPPAPGTTTVRKLLPHPAHSKHGRRRGQGSGVRSSLGALGSLWRDRREEREEEEEEEEEVTEYSARTTTLKGTRVTSSNGDNYIILSPINPGSQLLQPVYHDRNGTIGRLYQTHPNRGQNLLHDPRSGSSRRSFNSRTATLAPPPSSASTSSASSAPPGSYGNYQNCTIVQSHLPCSGYGTYVTLTPKTLIFPVFVQPLDLCSPDRTLLMSEEMILHQANLLPAKVTVLIYSDLLLLTREDEAGRCNVLQSPLYLNTLQLREVAAEPLQLYVLQCVQVWRCVFSLEAFSLEQKNRVRLCLHDNIQQQLVATETSHSQQLPDLQSDLGLLSLSQSDFPYRSSPYSSYSSSNPSHHPSSPYTSLCDPLRPSSPSPYSPGSPSPFSSSPPPPFSSLVPFVSSPPARSFTPPQLPPSPLAPPPCLSDTPVWRERERGGRGEEEERRRREREVRREEERQQGEGESASETSESVGGVRGHAPPKNSPSLTEEEEEGEDEEEDSDEDDDEEEEFSSPYTAALCRSLSEGSLLQEPRSPRFLSDSTIHRLTRPTAFGPAPCPPSPHTLRRQLTKEGGSLQQMLLLLNGTKDTQFKNVHQRKKRKKTKNLAADVCSRLAFLRRRNNNILQGNSLEKALRNHKPSAEELLRWTESFEALLANKYGLTVFRHFLRSEFSEENLDFWLAVEKYKKTRPLSKMAARANKIYNEFISTSAARQVNVDSSVRDLTNQSLCRSAGPASFQLAQDQIYSLMETDSYPRFLRSRLYTQLANHSVPHTQTANQNEPGCPELSQQKMPSSVVGQS